MTTYIQERGDISESPSTHRPVMDRQAGGQLSSSPPRPTTRVSAWKATGHDVILSDQVKSFDWQMRTAELWRKLPPAICQDS
jgi:hypothetical protein